MSLERELAAYYDQEAEARAGRRLDPLREEQRAHFCALLAREDRDRLLEIGTGPGRDAAALVSAGVRVYGVDLSSEHARRARGAGAATARASVLALPFRDAGFDAAFTMSTLLHVPNDALELALCEIVRVLEAGAPIAIGLWGGEDREGPLAADTIEPKRFFSVRSDRVLRARLERHGALEQFITWPSRLGWNYQWCVLRTPRARLTGADRYPKLGS